MEGVNNKVEMKLTEEEVDEIIDRIQSLVKQNSETHDSGQIIKFLKEKSMEGENALTTAITHLITEVIERYRREELINNTTVFSGAFDAAKILAEAFERKK